MKKYLLILGVLVFIASCTSNKEEQRAKEVQDSIRIADSCRRIDSIANVLLEKQRADSARIADSLAKDKPVKKTKK